MADRVIANTLEQATSTDFNAAQSMQARALSDVTRFLAESCQAPVQQGNGAFITPGAVAPKAIISGLHVYSDGDTTRILVGPGTLTQTTSDAAPLSGPAWTGSLDPATTSQTGISRAPVSVPYPSTSGLGLTSGATEAWHLLCTRLAPVVTLTDTVRVLNESTLEFENVSRTKRVELRPEFAFVLGSALNSNSTVMPNLDAGGNDWEPLAYVMFVDGGANLGKVIDVARRIPTSDVVSPGVGELASMVTPPTQLLQRLSSVRSPDCSPSVAGTLTGGASSHIGGERVVFASSQDDRQKPVLDATGPTAPADWQLVHYYLCPIQGTARRRWPMHSHSDTNDGAASNVARGLFVASLVQPNRRKENSAAITLYDTSGALGKYAAFSAVPAGAAQYIGSGHSHGGSFSNLKPMVVTSGGSVLYQLGEETYNGGTYTDAFTCPSVGIFQGLSLGAAAALNRSLDIDLRNMVPHCATVVYLHVETMGHSDCGMIFYEVRNRVNDAINQVNGPPSAGTNGGLSGVRLASMCMQTQNPAGYGTNLWSWMPGVLRVPVGWVPAIGHGEADLGSDDRLAYHLYLKIRQFAESCQIIAKTHVRLLGWDT